MNIKYFLFSGILFTIFLSFTSCCDDTCEPPQEEKEACFTKDIDKAIVFDTLWKKSFSLYYSADVKYSDKYFYIKKSLHNHEFYSVEDGTKIQEVYDSVKFGYFTEYIDVKGDYLYGFSSDKNGLEKHIFKYNIKTNELTTVDYGKDMGLGLAFEEDYFYYMNQHALIKTDYDLSFRDTIMKVEDEYSGIWIKVYEYPKPENKKVILMAYELDDLNNEGGYFKIININSKNVEESIFLNSNTSNFLRFPWVSDDMVNITGTNLVFSYDLKSGKYFNLHTNFYNFDKVYSISGRKYKDGEKSPVIFFQNLKKFMAYNMEYEETLWSCYESKLFSLYPVDIYDNDNNAYTYITYSGLSNRGNLGVGLMDPYTGIIKAQISDRHSISQVYDKNIIFIWNRDEIVKIKISRK